MMALLIFQLAMILIVVLAIVSFVRLNRFSRVLDRAINETFQQRIKGNSVPWPDVAASYRNLKMWEFYKWDFQSLIVYDPR